MIRLLSTTVEAVLEGARRTGGAEAFAAPEDLIAARARRGVHADRTLAGRAALRLLLAHVLGEPPARARDLPVDRTCDRCGAPHGRPRSPGASLSGSTSQVHVLVAVSTQEAKIGVDVQSVPASLWQGFDAAVLHPLDHRPGRRRSGTVDLHSDIRLWTRKEALLKAAGTGLRIEPSRIPLVRRSPEDTPWWSTPRAAPPEVPPQVQGLHVRDLPGSVPRAVAASSMTPVHEVDLAAVLAAA